MFNVVRENKRLVQIILGLCCLPFAFFGVDYVKNSTGGNDLANVGGSAITQEELQQTLREQQDRMRASLGSNFDAAMFDTPEARRSALDSIINKRLLAVHANKAKLGVSDQQLTQFIMSIPALQENGKFSPKLYETLVAGQGMTKEGFEQRLRYDLMLQQPIAAVGDASVVSKTSAGQWVATSLEKRDIAEVSLSPEQYLAEVKLAPDAAKNFYDKNRKLFETPEQVRAEYLVLSQQDIAAKINISDEDAKAAYNAQKDRYEERRASHILINAPKGAPEAEVKAAKAKAEDVLAQVKKSPGDFAKLAKQYSQDPGTADKGGDLDFFKYKMMEKPFADAAFALKEGKVSELVRTDYGFHIIKLTAIRADKSKTFESLKAEILKDLKMQAATKKFAESAEIFTNMVYEQSDSLKPAAEKFGLTIQAGPWIAKAQKIPGAMGNAKLMAALFSDDAVKNKRNTEAVEVASNTLVAARVLEHKAAELFPLEKVAADIEKRLKREEAAKLVAKDAEAKVAKLNAGEKLEFKWANARTVQRLGAQGMSPTSIRAVFAAPVAKLPAFTSAALPDGSTVLYRVDKVIALAPDAKADERTAALRQQYSRIVAEEEFSAWLQTLRERYTVKINQKLLDTKPQQQ